MNGYAKASILGVKRKRENTERRELINIHRENLFYRYHKIIIYSKTIAYNLPLFVWTFVILSVYGISISISSTLIKIVASYPFLIIMNMRRRRVFKTVYLSAVL